MSTEKPKDASDWELGSVSAHYEANGKGPATISNGKGDHGGVSYGLFQFSTHSKTINEFIEGSGYGSQFGSLQSDFIRFPVFLKNQFH